MPIYEYQCQECGEVFDKFTRSMSAKIEVDCPKCGSKDCKKSFSLFGSSSSTGGSRPAAACAPSG